MVDLIGHEAGNGGYSQRKPTAHRDSSTRKLALSPNSVNWRNRRKIDPPRPEVDVTLRTDRRDPTLARKDTGLLMDWAFQEHQVRFDIRAEREEYERLFRHAARVLQDRLVRCGSGDRTRRPAIPEVGKTLLAKGGAAKAAASSKGPRLGQTEERLLRVQNHLTLSRVLAQADEG
jgi:hypothetical protein